MIEQSDATGSIIGTEYICLVVTPDVTVMLIEVRGHALDFSIRESPGPTRLQPSTAHKPLLATDHAARLIHYPSTYSLSFPCCNRFNRILVHARLETTLTGDQYVVNILIIGGAGRIGKILQPALEREHCCYYFDTRPIPGAEARSFVGDVRKDALVDRAVAGCDALVYLAMGIKHGSVSMANDIDPAFSINVGGWCRFLQSGLRAGVRRFIYASSMSVYEKLNLKNSDKIDEINPANAWNPYGLSKRFGEELCQIASSRHPDAVIIALRMFRPFTDKQWHWLVANPEHYFNFLQGPDDLRRLYLDALACDTPGAHIFNTTGDVDAKKFPNAQATKRLGWSAKDNFKIPETVRNSNIDSRKVLNTYSFREFWVQNPDWYVEEKGFDNA